MNKYDIKFINEIKFGVITYKYYQVVNYDGNEEQLEEYRKELEKDEIFNVSWYIKDKEKGILEKMIDTLD